MHLLLMNFWDSLIYFRTLKILHAKSTSILFLLKTPKDRKLSATNYSFSRLQIRTASIFLSNKLINHIYRIRQLTFLNRPLYFVKLHFSNFMILTIGNLTFIFLYTSSLQPFSRYFCTLNSISDILLRALMSNTWIWSNLINDITFLKILVFYWLRYRIWMTVYTFNISNFNIVKTSQFLIFISIY